MGLAAVVDARAFDDLVDLIAICFGLRQRFEQQSPDTFTWHIAIPILAKAAAAPIASGKFALRQKEVFVGINGEIDPARQHIRPIGCFRKPDGCWSMKKSTWYPPPGLVRADPGDRRPG